MCFGDFNYTVYENEKFGGVRSSSSTVNYLKELMFDYGAIDLGFSGSKFTWAKGRWGNANLKRRLDRGIASISQRLAFPKANVSHLKVVCLYHTPILLNTSPVDTFAHRQFRFEAAWMRDPRFYDVIDKAWNKEVSGFDFVKLCKKQAATKKALCKWNREVFGHYQQRINTLL